MADYTPPVSPEIVFTFKAAPYTPPATPNIVFNFGVEDGGGGDEGLLRTNYMILLTM